MPTSCPSLSLLTWSLLAWLALCGALVSGELASSSWRKPTINMTQDDCIRIAQAALDKGVSMLDPSGQFSDESWMMAARLYYELADLDMLTKQTTYRETLITQFKKTDLMDLNFTDFSLKTPRSWGHAAARAYQAYGDAEFLDYATQSWWYGRKFTLSASDVSAGKIESKAFAMQEECTGASMVGGTFWNNGVNDTNIRAYTAGTSALLAEATSDPLYFNAAMDSFNFFKSHFLNPLNQVQNNIDAKSCDVDSAIGPYNAGYLIEGLAVMYTISKNVSVQNLLDDVVTAAIQNPSWQGYDGIVSRADDKTGDFNYALGLSVAYARNATSPALREDLGKYLAVQFNAVMDLATENNSNVYGRVWIGPPSSVFSGSNQTTAGAVLIGAISVSSTTASSTSVTPAPSDTPSSASKGTSKKAIVGGVVGGVVILLLVIGGAILLWMRQRRRRERFNGLASPPLHAQSRYSLDGDEPSDEAFLPHPFDMPTPRDSQYATLTVDSAASSPLHSPGLPPPVPYAARPNEKRQLSVRTPDTSPEPMTMVSTAGPVTMDVKRPEGPGYVADPISGEGSSSSAPDALSAAVIRELQQHLQSATSFRDSMPPPEYSTAI
ncbi:hypothetical protein C8F01DRAFT_1160030 [Mycena amicta]|nr:hypothetical protein C8F01DRAFT_1160030 [Mycena amicta]